MDQASELFFEDNHQVIVDRAIDLYGIDGASIERLGSFESAVFEVRRDGVPFVLRATDSEHRTVEQIEAELEWVDYLATSDVPVCRPLRSKRGNLVEPLDGVVTGDRSCALILFEKAEGAKLKPEECTPEFVERWGEIIGRMHRLTRNYQPGKARRHHWYVDSDLVPPPPIEKTQPLVAARVREQINKVRAFPTSPNTYGLVHSDLHQGNFFVSDGSLRIFDTDDCHYDFFLNDLSMPLYYTFHDGRIGNYSTAHAKEFWGNLMEGYRRQVTPAKDMLRLVPEFLKLREMILYMIIIKEDIAEANDWCRRLMDGRRDRIENEIPVIDIDFTRP